MLHAIPLASRGLHVLPPTGMEPADLSDYRKLGVRTRRELRARR